MCPEQCFQATTGPEFLMALSQIQPNYDAMKDVRVSDLVEELCSEESSVILSEHLKGLTMLNLFTLISGTKPSMRRGYNFC